MSEPNGELPHGWTCVKLGDVLEFKYGKSLPANRREGASYSVFGSNGIVGQHSEALVKGPVLIIGRKGSIGEIHHSDEPCWPIDTTYFVDDFYGQPIRFWYHQLKVLPLAELNRATALPGLNRSDAYDLVLKVPPIAEQRRIMAKIEILQERSRSARKVLAEVGPLLEQFRQSALAAAFRGDLTADWRAAHLDVEPASELLRSIRTERRRQWEQAELAKYEAKGQDPPQNWKEKYKEPEPVDNSGLPELPAGWIWATIDELTTFITSGSRGWAKYYSDAGPFFIRAQNIKTDRLIMDDIAHVTPPLGSEGERTRVTRNDLLITITGANVTKAAMVDIDIDEAYVSQHIALARLVDPKLAKYLYLWTISASKGRSQLLAAAYGNGKPGLNLDNIRKVAVALPPVTEQVALLAMVEGMLHKVDLLGHEVKVVENELDQLDQSILARAFRGELVPQDPNDELASVLLGRIRDQREQQAEATEKTFKMRRRNKMDKKSSGLPSQRRPLAEVLAAKGQAMSPERLLTEAGYEHGSIEDFYLALREEIKKGRIREERPSERGIMLEVVAQ